MKMKTKIKPSLLLLTTAVVVTAYWSWESQRQGSGFECRGRVHTKLIANACNKSSVVDVFLSMHGDNKGYLLVSGTHSCSKTAPRAINGTVDFTYEREGSYYSIHMGQRHPELVELFDILKDDDIKIKVTSVNNGDYILTSPIETIMMCTED
ncbi:Uncharacterised protein [Serratia fonticola]|nr:Uncharacterised protein [Serratia fonticola]